MKRLSIQDIIRSTYVDRWQIVRTLRKQNLAEHQYIVTMISIEIAENVMGEYFDDTGRLMLMNWCMRHDLREVMHGDICTPVKQRIKSKCGNNTFDEIDRDICDICNESEDNINGTVYKDIAKLADLIDGIRFLILEGHGKHANAVLIKIRETLSIKMDEVKKNYKGYDWDKLSSVLKDLVNDECYNCGGNINIYGGEELSGGRKTVVFVVCTVKT